MKILIINPVIRKEDKARLIPHGLGILANMIRRDIKTTPYLLDINALRPTDRQVEQIIDDYHPDVTMIGGNGNNTYGLAKFPAQGNAYKSYTVIDRFNTSNDKVDMLAMGNIVSATGFMSYGATRDIIVKRWGTQLTFTNGAIYDTNIQSTTITEGKLSFTNIRPSNIASNIKPLPPSP